MIRERIIKFRKQINFLIVGSTAAFVDIFALMFLREVLHMGVNISITIAYSLSAIVHFSCNRHIVFKDAQTNICNSIIRYFILLFINYITNLIIINFCINYLDFILLLSKIIATGTCTIISYIVMNYFVFNGNRSY